MSTRLKLKAAEPRTEDEGRALVTGAAGFIGSHLAERLLALGADSFDEHYSDRLKRLNLARAEDDARFELVEADIGRDEIDSLKPISPYAATKVMTEALASVYSSSCGLDAVGLRYFSVYRPRQRPERATSELGYVPSISLREGLEEQVADVLGRCNSLASGSKGKRG